MAGENTENMRREASLAPGGSPNASQGASTQQPPTNLAEKINELDRTICNGKKSCSEAEFMAINKLWKEVMMGMLTKSLAAINAIQQNQASLKVTKAWSEIVQTTTRPPPHRIEREIKISRQECEDLVGEEANAPAIVAKVNKEIEPKGAGKIVAARKLLSGDVVLVADSSESKNSLTADEGWVKVLGSKARLSKMRYTVIVKSVHYKSLKEKALLEASKELLKQNPQLQGRVEILGLHHSEHSDRKAGPLYLDLASPSQANLVIQEGIILENVYHDAEVFHRGCRITRCFKCHQMGHTAKFCRRNVRCGFCGKEGHDDKKCEIKEQNKTPKCSNCKGNHPVWSKDCSVQKAAAEQAQVAYLNRPARFATPDKEIDRKTWITIPSTGKRNIQQSSGGKPGRPKRLDLAGREQAGQLEGYLTTATNQDMEMPDETEY